MRITNLVSGFTLAVIALFSSFTMAAEPHAQHEKQKAKSTSQAQSPEMAHAQHQHSAHDHATMLKQQKSAAQPSSKQSTQTPASKQSNAQKGDHHVHH